MAQFRDLRMVLPHRMRTLISAIIHEASLTYDMEGDGLYPLSNAPKGGRQLVCLYLEELLILLYRQLTDTTGIVPAKELPGEMILYLNSHVYDRLSVSDLCQRMHYGKTHLSQLFREAIGDSIMQYYRRLKINEAKRLLRDPEQTVAEVAALLCFDTPQYFTRVFKSHTGLTPAEWRDSLQNGQNPELNPERLPRKKEK
jgi:AraC-like DNA-binding protein